MDVKASADGIVESVETSEETGRTVSISIGDGFTVVYGQLKDISVSKVIWFRKDRFSGKLQSRQSTIKKKEQTFIFK